MPACHESRAQPGISLVSVHGARRLLHGGPQPLTYLLPLREHYFIGFSSHPRRREIGCRLGCPFSFIDRLGDNTIAIALGLSDQCVRLSLGGVISGVGVVLRGGCEVGAQRSEGVQRFL